MIKIISLLITPFAQNFKLVFDNESRDLIVIDPGGEVGKIMELIESEFRGKEFNRVYCLLTHAHIDHGGGVKAFLSSFNKSYGMKPKLIFHKDNDLYRETIEGQAQMYGLPSGEYENVPAADLYLSDEDVVEFGVCEPKALFTPGHAPGHLALFFPDGEFELMVVETPYSEGLAYSHQGPLLVAGDALFRGSIGRTDLPGGNHEQLLTSIQEKLFTLPDETLVLSGHGPDTQIGLEKRTNPFLN